MPGHGRPAGGRAASRRTAVPRCTSCPPGPVLSTVHVGAYDELSLAYTALLTAAHERGHEPREPIAETYLTDPAQVAPAEYVTRLGGPDLAIGFSASPTTTQEHGMTTTSSWDPGLPAALGEIRTRPLLAVEFQVPPPLDLGATPTANRRVAVIEGGASPATTRGCTGPCSPAEATG